MTRVIYSVLFIVLFHNSLGSVNPRFYPKYHLAPPFGWMNDPNGFCYFNGYYHLFYQHNPNSSKVPGIAHWGHAKSTDFFNWVHLPIAMAPDESYDRGGVFSGSAIIENNTMYLYYTGNVNYEGQTPNREEHQALAISYDGVTVTKYENNPVIEGNNRQPNFRDPKVWKHSDTYYMVVGNSYNNDTLGRVVLYSSKDKYNWKDLGILDQSYGFFGYMWECPDLFELDGLFVFLLSPQGMKSQGIRFNNLYQTGYFVGHFDYESLKFTHLTEFRELDFGHDFYATQSIEDKNGDRVVVAWVDMWERNYPEGDDGFTGHMSIPRVLSLDRYLRLIQKPVKQIENVVGKMLYSGEPHSDTSVELEDRAGKIVVSAPGNQDFELIIEASGESAVTITYKDSIGLVTLDRGGDDGKRSTRWRPRGKLCWTVYVDSSSVEAFLGGGEVTFTSRFFAEGPLSVRIGKAAVAHEMIVHSMKQTMPSPAGN